MTIKLSLCSEVVYLEVIESSICLMMSRQYSVSTSSYQTSDSDDDVVPVTTVQEPTQKKYCSHGIRKIKSNGAILVLISVFLVYGAVNALYALSTKGNYMHNSRALQAGPGTVVILILVIFCPLAGWLADVHFGRYKVMRVGLWLMWIGTVFFGITMIFYVLYGHGTFRMKLLNFTGILPSAILFTAGLAAFAVNALQFGVDQMPDASAEEVSAFIHWFVWAMFAGDCIGDLTNIVYYCTNTEKSIYAQAVQSIIPATMTSLALCCDFLFRRMLTIEPESQNPLKTVSGVLKYAATHKSAERPRAITYCEDERPSRIDFAKEKYGGPYTTEEVEDVKTCGRMLVVIASTAALMIPVETYVFSRVSFQSHFKHIIVTNCLESVVEASYVIAVFAVISIPIYEVLLYPLARNRIPSMLKRVGIGAIFTIILNLILLAVNMIGHTAKPSGSCMFNASSTSIPLDIDYIWIDATSNFLAALQLLLFLVAIMEFTLAQAPYNMKGFLVGLAHSLIFSTFTIGYGIFVAWDTKYESTKHWKPNCGFWFFLSQALFAIFGLGILCVVAKWYKRRQRDEPPYDRAALEDMYSR